MKPTTLVATFLLAASSLHAGNTQVTLVESGERWKYLDNGTSPGASWKDSLYDDTAWQLGRTRAGYGEGNETTTVSFGSNASNKYITTYFRHVFFVDDPARYTSLALSLTRDDGAVVYLNGTEIVSSNMPPGPYSSTTLASSAVSGSDEFSRITFAPSPALLAPGRNVFAVEVHQAAPDSSDLGFDLELLASASAPVATTTRFAVIGDFGIDSAGELAVANMVKSWNPTLIATTGDNNYPSGAAGTIDTNIGKYYHDYIYQYTGGFGAGSATQRFLPVLGNHDWMTSGAQPYLDYFTLPGNERYWDYRQDALHIFGIDSDSNEPDGITADSKQGNWLQDRLASSDAPWKLVLLHHSPFSSSSAHGSQPTLQWPYADWGASVVMSGHDHLYERIHKSSTPYIVNGAGGAPLYSFSSLPVAGSALRYSADFGAVLGEYSPEYLSLQFFSISGTPVDTLARRRPISPWTIDGLPEPSLPALSADGITLLAARQGDWLYVATQSFSGGDHFIYVALTPGAMRPANWSKAGQIAAWDFFVAKERTGAFNSWYERTQHMQLGEAGFHSAAQDGHLLEGAINLREAFGSIPSQVWLAVAAYESQDGGTLIPSRQSPAPSAPNGDIEAGEYVAFPLSGARVMTWERY